MSPDDAENHARLEKGLVWARVLWHAGLTAESALSVVAEMMRRDEVQTGASVRVLLTDHGANLHPADLTFPGSPR